MTEKHILELRDDLDEQYKKDRETLDRMLDLVRRQEPNGSDEEESDPTRGMLIKDKIAYYVLSIPNNFTMQDARKFIQEKDPRFASKLRPDALSAALYRMTKEGQVKIVIAKKGISAAIYSKNDDYPPADGG